MDIALVILRLVVGLLFVGHGTQKLFGWFGGDGLRGTAAYVESLGYRPGLPFALLAGLAEAGGGALLALGLGTPVGAAAIVAQAVNIQAAHAGNGPWNENGGWELPLVFGAVAAALGFAGPGVASLDAALGWAVTGTDWGIAVAAAGLGAGLVPRLVRRVAPSPGAERVAASGS